MITQKFLKERYIYKDGELVYRQKVRGTVKGQVAGTSFKDTYRKVSIDNKLYFVHRLVYLYHTGELPEYVDHINGDRTDNRISNLRSATHSENIKNSKLREDSKSGYKNVSYHKKRNHWVVSLKVNGYQKYIGAFKELELAGLVANQAREKYYGEFA